MRATVTWRRRAALLAAAAAVAGAGPTAGQDGAPAAAPGLTVVGPAGTPAPGERFTLTVQVTGGGTTRLVVRRRASDGGACPATPVWPGSVPVVSRAGAGTRQVRRAVRIPASGTYRVCAWLTGAGGAVVAAAGREIVVRRPAAVIAVTAAEVTLPRRPRVLLTGQSEARGRVVARYRPADGVPCAAGPVADPGRRLPVLGAVEGPFRRTTLLPVRRAGAYTVCAWVVTGGPDRTPLAVASATVVVRAVSRRPLILSARVTGRRLLARMLVRGPGRLEAALTGRGRTVPVADRGVAGTRLVTVRRDLPADLPAGRHVLVARFTAEGAQDAAVARRVVRVG